MIAGGIPGVIFRQLCPLILLLLLAGCGGSDADESDMRVENDAAMDTTPAGTAAPPSLPGLAGDVRRQTTVALREYALEVGEDALPAGEVTFQVMNTGTETHSLAVEGAGIDEHSDPVEPGATASLSVELGPGTYRLYCPDSGASGRHAALGMSVPFVVR